LVILWCFLKTFDVGTTISEKEKLEDMLDKVVAESSDNMVAQVEYIHKIQVEKDKLDVYRIEGEGNLGEPPFKAKENKNLIQEAVSKMILDDFNFEKELVAGV